MRSSRHNQRWPRPRDGPSHRLAITVPCCAHFREGPVLAILAMLALKDALCVAPGGSAPLFPFRSAPWPPMFQAGTGKRRLNRTRKPARHDRSHALTTQKGTSWRCGNRGPVEEFVQFMRLDVVQRRGPPARDPVPLVREAGRRQDNAASVPARRTARLVRENGGGRF